MSDSQKAPQAERSGTIYPLEPGTIKLQCSCGKQVPVGRETVIRCACGQEVAQVKNGVVTAPNTTGYWGEITKPEMDRLIAGSQAKGWRAAVAELPENMQDNIMSPKRAAFQDALPLPDGALVLDIGSGLGAVATDLARRYRVVALEGVAERSHFTAIRRDQDGLDSLLVMNANFAHLPLAPGQFDCITVIGVLEWAGMFDLSLPVEEAQEKFMRNLQRLLAPGGVIILGIENRFGWAQMTGTLDHSGLPYTSLLPRWATRLVCSRSSQFCSSFNTGYRTYTYGYEGYRELFERSGLGIETFWVVPSSYHAPTSMVPVHGPAIASYVQQHWLRPNVSAAASLKNWIKKQTATEWFWRRFGSDYMFLLRALPR